VDESTTQEDSAGDLKWLTKKTLVTRKKPVSKVASLKKLLNKKIQLNTHVKFDEEGLTVSSSKDRYDGLDEGRDSDSGSEIKDSITPVPISEYESQRDGAKIGGIEICRAQQMILARDKVDKLLEKQRIQQAHRERRLKKRKRKTTGEEEEQPAVSLSIGEGDCPKEETEESETSDLEGEVKRRREGEEGVASEGSQRQLGMNFEPVLKDDEVLARHLLGL